MTQPPDVGVDPWAVLDALPRSLLVLDADARVRYRSRAAVSEPPAGGGPLSIGDDYLSACEATFDAATSARLTTAIRDVLSGRSRSASIDGIVRTQGPPRWFAVEVQHCVVLGRHGAVVEQHEIT